MALKRSDFAEECATQSLRFGINPHYLVAAAQLRSAIAEGQDGERVGPFRLTQAEWDANCADAEFGITDMEPGDLAAWDMQCLVYGLMTCRAQNALLSALGRYPSAVELYSAQWPAEVDTLASRLQAALDATADLIAQALGAVLGTTPTDPPVLAKVEGPASVGTTDPSGPRPKAGEALFLAKAPKIMERLMDDFGLEDFQAAGLLGNIGHECAGFTLMQEVRAPGSPGKGGFGWCQWTRDRRDAFEAFCEDQGLLPASDAANYAFLKRELAGGFRSAVAALKTTATLPAAVRAFEREFEKAKVKRYESRDRWATLALGPFRRRLPAKVAALLDPDASVVVSGKASDGSTTYWVLDETGDDGGQLLVKQPGDGDPEVLARDTTVHPIARGLVPDGVAKALDASFGGGDPHPPTGAAGARSDDEAAKRVFASAESCDDRLVTRTVPDTNGGRVACAWAVNEVVRRALGRPIGGGLSTAEMAKVLRAKHQLVPEGRAGPGTVVISPTQGKNIGHVGIVGVSPDVPSKTLIYSNSSSRGVFTHAFTLARWKSYYATRKGLPVLFYSLKA